MHACTSIIINVILNPKLVSFCSAPYTMMLHVSAYLYIATIIKYVLNLAAISPSLAAISFPLKVRSYNFVFWTHDNGPIYYLCIRIIKSIPCA